MFATVIGQAFSDWVEDAIIERNSGLADKSGLMVGMNPEVAKVFAASTNLSSRYRPHFSILLFPYLTNICCSY